MVWHACYSMFFTVSGALSLTWPSVTFMPTNHLHSLKALEGCQQGDAALWAPINPWCHIRQMSLRVGEAESAWTSLLPVLSSAHIWLIIYMLQNYLSLVSVEVFESNSPNFWLLASWWSWGAIMDTGICWSARDLLPHYNLLNNPLRCDGAHFSDEDAETQRVYIACPKSIGNNYHPSELSEKL